MKTELAREVIACLPQGRTLFHYSKDDYAFHLLHWLGKEEEHLHELRSRQLGRLLEKPALKPHLAHCHDGKLRHAVIPRSQYLPEGKAYRLSLELWGTDVKYWQQNQVSRKGVSLVFGVTLLEKELIRP